MNTVSNYLSRLGFSEKEAKTYLILLKVGSMNVTSLAQKADINRTAAYGYINSLIKKRVVSQAKGTSSKIIANPPAQLHNLVDQRISTVNVLQEELPAIVTFLNTSFMRTHTTRDSDIHYYKGRNSVKAIYTEVLKANKIRAYFTPEDLMKTFPENALLFNNIISKNTNLSVYEIIQDTPMSRNYMQRSGRMPRYFWKFLPKDIKLTANDILLYDGKVAIINIGDKQNVTGVVLENRDYYNNSVQLFDLLWRLLPPSDNV